MVSIEHINLQPDTGGGEVYTHALSRALAEAGARVRLYVHPANRLWDDLASQGMELVRAADERQLVDSLPRARSIVLTHSPLSLGCLDAMARTHLVAGFAHMPAYQRGAEGFGHYHYVATVSRYCIDLLRAAGIAHVHPEPMYGVADAGRGDPSAEIWGNSPYVWDRRKMRDRLLGLVQPLAHGRRRFRREAAATFGIVSGLVPIKQFPLLFSIVAPILAKRGVRLEVFGAGGYAQVRDLRRALRPLGGHARFWGHQRDVAAIYPQLDYLMTGLPEKEALGLNVLEAQACGTPVLAPRGGPFAETVLDGRSGFLYRDPREDGGRDFERIVAGIVSGAPRPDPRLAGEHLAAFSYAAFAARAASLLAVLEELAATRVPSARETIRAGPDPA